MKINRWQRAWIVLSLVWLAYWLWVTRGMSFDSGDIAFIVRVMVAPPLLLYVVGWLVARVIRLIRAR
jgi:hypothetical protein